MIKKFRFLVGLVVFVTGSIVTLTASPVKPVQAAPVDSTALYKIVPVETESVPAGAKISLTVAVTTKKLCSITGTSVKALLPGTCSISVKVTPKATAKVKKPKSTTSKIKILIIK